MLVGKSSAVMAVMMMMMMMMSCMNTGSMAFMVSSGTHQKMSTALNAASALIVQNKGGGHGELGYQLAQVLLNEYAEKISSVTILQDDACKDESEPFASYATDLPTVNVIKAPLSSDDGMTAESLQQVLGDGQSFDYVWDNASKGPVGSGKAICDCCKEWDTKLLTYVSSAGMYQPTPDTTFPMDEGTTPIKESAGQHLYDVYASEELGLPYVSFRPQYIYGSKSNKYDYLDWYFDRLARELPLPIPSPGTQKVSLTNSKDVASLLSSVLNNEAAAIEQRYFNCGTDQLLTYDEVAYLCAEAAGVDKDKVFIEHYNADTFGKANFPFRMTDFYVAPDTAKKVLGWEGPKHSLKEDLNDWYYSQYANQRDGPNKPMKNLSKDWEIVVGSKSHEEDGSIYQKYDPITIDFSNVKELNVE